jgi:hypothetical protein
LGKLTIFFGIVSYIAKAPVDRSYSEFAMRAADEHVLVRVGESRHCASPIVRVSVGARSFRLC